MNTPPLSGKAARAMAAEAERLHKEAEQLRAHITEAVGAAIQARNEMGAVDYWDERERAGWPRLVIWFKGDRLAEIYRRHGFSIEGNGGDWMTATYEGKAKNG